eukprot:11545701-Ditylum_brightwellii.AAC.1
MAMMLELLSFIPTEKNALDLSSGLLGMLMNGGCVGWIAIYVGDFSWMDKFSLLFISRRIYAERKRSGLLLRVFLPNHPLPTNFLASSQLRSFVALTMEHQNCTQYTLRESASCKISYVRAPTG